MEKIAALLLSLIVMLTGCTNQNGSSTSTVDSTASSISQTEQTDNDIHENEPMASAGFTVDGTRLLDANGNEFVMRGINHPHSWFAAEDDVALEAIAPQAQTPSVSYAAMVSSTTATARIR